MFSVFFVKGGEAETPHAGSRTAPHILAGHRHRGWCRGAAGSAWGRSLRSGVPDPERTAGRTAACGEGGGRGRRPGARQDVPPCLHLCAVVGSGSLGRAEASSGIGQEKGKSCGRENHREVLETQPLWLALPGPMSERAAGPGRPVPRGLVVWMGAFRCRSRETAVRTC